MQVEYKVVKSDDALELELEVIDCLNNGWVISGDMSHRGNTLYQALYKKKNNENEATSKNIPSH